MLRLCANVLMCEVSVSTKLSLTEWPLAQSCYEGRLSLTAARVSSFSARIGYLSQLFTDTFLFVCLESPTLFCYMQVRAAPPPPKQHPRGQVKRQEDVEITLV